MHSPVSTDVFAVVIMYFCKLNPTAQPDLPLGTSVCSHTSCGNRCSRLPGCNKHVVFFLCSFLFFVFVFFALITVLCLCNICLLQRHFVQTVAYSYVIRKIYVASVREGIKGLRYTHTQTHRNIGTLPELNCSLNVKFNFPFVTMY